MSAEKLYTPQRLAAAVALAEYPPLPNATAHGEARSSTCGSTIAMDVECADGTSISAIGMKVSACAVGQASAAIFARHAAGRSADEIATSREAIAAWLTGSGSQPDWPELDLIAPARDYPGRHGAMLLSWNAAMAGLSSTSASR